MGWKLNMEHIISISKAKVKTPHRISFDGYILSLGRTENKCKFDFIGTDIENWDSSFTLSFEETKRFKDSLKEKFGFSNFDTKIVNNEIAKDIQVRFKSD